MGKKEQVEGIIIYFLVFKIKAEYLLYLEIINQNNIINFLALYMKLQILLGLLSTSAIY